MRIAAFLFRRVGDSLLATPALRALKTRWPDAELSVVAEPHVARVFNHNPSVTNVVTIECGPSPLQLSAAARRGGKPDIVVDFLSDPRSAMATWLTGARTRVGFSRHGMNWAYTHRVARQDPQHPIYTALHKLELAHELGIETMDAHTEFYLTPDDRAFASAAWQAREWNSAQSVTAFFVFSRREHKRWPLHGFSDVITRMQLKNISTPLVLATPGDEDAVAELQTKANLPTRHVLKVNNLGQLGAVLERCRLLIGNDGGPKHVAVALGTPTLTLFGPDSPVYWTPPDSDSHLALTSNGPDLRSSIKGISPSKVYETAVRMLSALKK